jgi:type IV pilus assembly protein PilQ
VSIPKLEFSNLQVADALNALARAYNLSLFVDPSVTGQVTIRLENVSLNDALLFIITENKLAWQRTGSILKVFTPVPLPPPPKPFAIDFTDKLVSLNVEGIDIERVIDTLSELSGLNIVLDPKTRGKLTGKLSDLPLNKALEVLLSSNGFTMHTVDDIIYAGPREETSQAGAAVRNLQVSCNQGLVSIDVSNSKLGDVLRRLADECGFSVFLQDAIEGTTTARFSNRDVESALTYLLLNSNYTFKEQGGIYFIGSKESKDLYDSRLVQLDHLIAGTVEPLIPASLAQQVTVKVVKEHNGLLITGARTSIARIESFIKEIDVPMAQVLFEVLVVDYTTTDRAEFSLLANNSGADNGQPNETYYPDVDVNWIGDDVNNFLRSTERRTGWSNLGVLPDDFFVRLRMLSQEGKANMLSHPRIASLNGHTASLSIGTTQYYLLESQTVYPSQQTEISTQTSQRFETIKADLSLEITPFVNRSGELIVDVQPIFNSPSGEFDPDIPPTINRRELKSTVRLKNGETIVLGGLIQKTKNQTVDKVPLLGSIPIIGRIFQNRTTRDEQSEMMIYVTPHVYYGSEGSVALDTLLNK